MGGIDFRTRSRGKSVTEAYSKAVEISEDEHGRDPYNGTISTTDNVQDVTKEYQTSGKDLDVFIQAKLQHCNKRYCYAICTKDPVGNEMKVKSQVENLATKGTKKWFLTYEVYCGDRYVGSSEKKGMAVKIARDYTEKHQDDTYIVMAKKMKEASPVVAKIHYKKSKKEALGEWILFGIAAS